MNEERILLVVPRLSLDGAIPTVGDLIFTNRQVFLVRRAGNADLTRSFGKVAATEAGRRSRKVSRPQARPLDTILATADPRTRFEYRELQSITVRVGGLFSSPSVRFIPRHGRRLKFSGKSAALELLASAVPLLAGAGAPMSLS